MQLHTIKPPRLALPGPLDPSWAWAWRGLRFAFVADHWGTPIDLVTRASPTTGSSGPGGHNFTHVGMGMDAYGNGNMYSRWPSPIKAFPFTMLMVAASTSTSSSVKAGLFTSSVNNAEYQINMQAANWFRYARGSGNDPMDTAFAPESGKVYAVVAMSKAQNRHELWVNGVQAVTSTATAGAAAGLDRLTIGRRDGSTTSASTGPILAFLVWDRALSDGEIKALSRDPFGPFRGTSLFIPSQITPPSFHALPALSMPVTSVLPEIQGTNQFNVSLPALSMPIQPVSPTVQGSTIAELTGLEANWHTISVRYAFAPGQAPAAAGIQYRRVGASSWRTLDSRLVITDTRATTAKGFTNWAANEVRGKIFGLTPNRSYEVRVLDGSMVLAQGTVTTLDDTRPNPTTRQIYVDGTNGNDANDGLSLATAKATLAGALAIGLQPGDNVNIEPGTYSLTSAVTVTASGNGNNWPNNWISIGKRAGATGEVIFEGSHIDVNAEYIYLHDLTWRKTQAAAIRFNRQGSTTRSWFWVDNCKITDFNLSNDNQQQQAGIHATNNPRRVIVTNCTIIRREQEAGDQNAHGNGIWLKNQSSVGTDGGRHIIRGNTIIGGYDGIGSEAEDDSRGGFYINSDIYENQGYGQFDELVQCEGVNLNCAAFDNYSTQTGSRSSLAIAPSTVGPAYFFRNRGLSADVGGVKIGDQDEYTFLFHNSIYAPDTTISGGGDGIKQTNSGGNKRWLRNNAIRATRYNIEMTGGSGAGSSSDYNAFKSTRAGNHFQWNGTAYATLSSYQAGTGQDLHSFESDLENADWVNADAGDFRLKPNSALVGAGDRILGINWEVENPSWNVENPDIGWYAVTEEVPQEPAQVQGLQATAVSSSQINLSWTAVIGASSYDVERNGVVVATGIAGTSYQDKGLSASTLYTYRVRAVNSVGSGPYSGTASATTQPAAVTTPSQVTGLVATVQGPTSVLLTWNAASNAVIYEIQQNGAIVKPDVAVTSYLVTELNPGTQYTFRVRGVNSEGDPGAFSNPVTVTTDGIPEAPPATGMTLATLMRLLTETHAEYIEVTTTGNGAINGSTFVADNLLIYDAARMKNRWAMVLEGTAAGQVRRIAGVSGTTATMVSNFSTRIDSGDVVAIFEYNPAFLINAINQAGQALYPHLYVPLSDESIIVDNWIENASFETAGSGAQTIDGWTEEGSIQVTHNTVRVKHLKRSAKLFGAGAVGQLTQTVDIDIAAMAGRTVSFKAWVWTAGQARLGIEFGNGDGPTYGDYHPADSSWRLLSAVAEVPKDATRVKVIIEVASGTTAYVDVARFHAGVRHRYPLPAAFFKGPRQVFIQANEMEPDGSFRSFFRDEYPQSGRIIRLVGQGVISVPVNPSDTIEIERPYVDLLIAEARQHLHRTLANMRREERDFHIEEARMARDDVWARPHGLVYRLRMPQIATTLPHGIWGVHATPEGRYFELLRRQDSLGRNDGE